MSDREQVPSKDKRPLIEWARDRFERCVRLAKAEEPADRDEAFEDATYFRELLAILERQPAASSELLALLERRSTCRDEFRLAEGRGGEYWEELGEFDRAHDTVVDWVNEHPDELLAMLKPSAHEPPVGFNSITDECLSKHLAVAESVTLRSALIELQMRRAAQPPSALREVVQAVVDWNTKYPSSRIYGEASIRRIAAEMDQIFEQAKAALAGAAQPPSAWQPVETAPKDGTSILGYVLPPRMQANLEGPRIVKWAGEYGMWSMPGISGLTCSHWMPLPSPPTKVVTP